MYLVLLPSATSVPGSLLALLHLCANTCVVDPPPHTHTMLQGNFTFTAELIVALIAFLTSVWLSLYMGWAIHSLRLIPRFTNTLLACCGRQYEVSSIVVAFVSCVCQLLCVR